MIDEGVVNELMMWLTGGLAQMEAQLRWKQILARSKRWMEEVMRMGVMIGMVVEGMPHI